MADFTIKIESIDGGIAQSYHETPDNQYLGGIAIDPEAPIVSPYPSMAIVPINATKFSSTAVSSAPMWIMPNSRDSNLYVYCDDGKLISYSNVLASETTVYQLGLGAANGAAYYNNYLYLATSADVHRYGPLDNAPGMTVSAWTGATLGSQPGLSAANTFPANGNFTYPNHSMHVHNDGKLYFADYVAGNRPTINRISSLGDGTLPGGLRRALDLPPGYIVTDIESFGPDLAVLCAPMGVYSAGSIQKPGKSALFLWDTFNSVPYRQIDITDPWASALYNHNGQLRIFSGAIDGWVRVQGYTGGNSLIPIDYISEGAPPPAGAVDALGDMLAWGAYGTIPTTFTGVMTKGYRNSLLPPTARNCIQVVTDSGAHLRVTSLALINAANKYPLVGWKSDTAQGLDRGGTTGTYAKSYWRSKQFNLGQEFEITRIRIPLGLKISSVNMALNPTINVDNDVTTFTPVQLSNVVYNNKNIIDIKQTIKGNTNFNLQINWGGVSALPIVLPITINGRTLKDNE